MKFIANVALSSMLSMTTAFAQSAPDITSPLGIDKQAYQSGAVSAAEKQNDTEKWLKEKDCSIEKLKGVVAGYKSKLDELIQVQVGLVTTRDAVIKERMDALEKKYAGISGLFNSLDQLTLQSAASAGEVLGSKLVGTILEIKDVVESLEEITSSIAAYRKVSELAPQIAANSARFHAIREDLNSLGENMEAALKSRAEIIQAMESEGVVFQKGWYGQDCGAPSENAFDGVYGEGSSGYVIRGRSFKFLGPQGYATSHGGECTSNYSDFVYSAPDRASVEWRVICPDKYEMSSGKMNFSYNDEGYLNLEICGKQEGQPFPCYESMAEKTAP